MNGCGNGGSNTCNGEPFCVDAVKADGTAVKLLLQSQPKGGSGLYDRRDVTIWYKEVSANVQYTSAQMAADWTQGLQVSTQQSAYSAMALQADGRIAFFFEEAPCYGDDQAKGYCMVYAPLTIEEITEGSYSTPARITISNYDIGTFYANEAVEIPEGLTAYVAITAPEMNGEEGIITMSKIEDGIIPAQTGVVIRGAEGTYTFTQTNENGTTDTESNMLRGYAGTAESQEVALPTDGSVNYVLTVKDGNAGFYRKDAAFKVYNHKAYLNVPAAQGVRSLTIRFEGDSSTGIELTAATRRGAAVVYDLQGRRVESPTKGIYIKAGKKTVIK